MNNKNTTWEVLTGQGAVGTQLGPGGTGKEGCEGLPKGLLSRVGRGHRVVKGLTEGRSRQPEGTACL